MEFTSEVARLRRQIGLEYQSSNRLFTDFTPTARHDYITARQDNIEVCYQELKKHMHQEDAFLVLIQAENNVYGISFGENHASV